jgi:hypothetical protein
MATAMPIAEVTTISERTRGAEVATKPTTNILDTPTNTFSATYSAGFTI